MVGDKEQNRVQIEGLLEIAAIAALQAGEAIMQIYSDPDADFQIERKADNSPLTLADRASHRVIVGYLTQTSFPILSEEGVLSAYEERKDWAEFWIVDPLDGTKEFIKRNGEFTVNIALVRQGVPDVGVIYVPVKRTLYVASGQIGAYRIDEVDASSDLKEAWQRARRLPLAGQPVESPYVVVASRSHLSPETEAYIDALRATHADVQTICSGSSLKICQVAEGGAHVYPRFAPTMEWDTAAGHAIARAAGMEIYQADGGEPVTYRIQTPLQYNKEDLHNPWFIVEKKRTL